MSFKRKTGRRTAKSVVQATTRYLRSVFRQGCHGGNAKGTASLTSPSALSSTPGVLARLRQR